jgi:Mg-chelatase subunit ChlD
MKLLDIVSLALFASPILASPYSNGVFRRDTGTCSLQLATSNGGRKVAIVLDSSGSMSSTDPKKLRVTAGKALNNQLVSAAGAVGGKTADLVTVVE